MTEATTRTRIIGLGNPILSDDAVGIVVAQQLATQLAGRPEVEVIEAEAGGFDLLELLVGWERVILIDAVEFGGVAPGTIQRLEVADLHTSLRLRGVHEIDLPTVVALGEKLGMAMPSELVIFVVQGAEMLCLGRELTPAVAAAVPRLVTAVCAWLDSSSPAPFGLPAVRRGDERILQRTDLSTGGWEPAD